MSPNDFWPDEAEEESFDESLYGETPVLQNQGCSTGAKVLLLMLFMAGGFFVLCCGGVIWVYSQFEFDETAEGVLVMTEEIADIDIPESFEPQRAMEMDLLIMSMKLAIYTAGTDDSVLILAETDFPTADQKLTQAEMKIVLRQQDRGGRYVDIINSETREFEIRGQTVKFVFAECEDIDTGEAVCQITGTFSGRQGMGFLMLQVEDESYDEDAVVRMIESIK